MFCINCGSELLEKANFCGCCGAIVEKTSIELDRNNSKISLVKAQCTNCNAPLDVDTSQAAAICKYCGMPFIVEQAIKNYNIHVNSSNLNITSAVINMGDNTNVNNLLLRAQKFEKGGEYNLALEYYNKVLDIDINQESAQSGVERVKRLIENYEYFRTNSSTGWTNGKLVLKQNMLIFEKKRGVNIYYLARISKIKPICGGIKFLYDGVFVSFSCQAPKEITEIILNAQNGNYPKFRIGENSNVE